MPLSKIPNSAFETPVESFDDNKIVNDLSTLALREASNENRTAYNSNSQSVDVFQDASRIDTKNNAIRNIGEYVSSEGVSSTFIAYDYDTMDFPDISNNGRAGTAAGYTNAIRPTYAVANNQYPIYTSTTGEDASQTTYDFGTEYEFGSQVTLGRFKTSGCVTTFRLRYSTDGSTYTGVNMSGATSLGVSIGSGGSSGGGFSNAGSNGDIDFGTVPTDSKMYAETITMPNSFTARYIRLSVMGINGGNGVAGYGTFLPYGKFPIGLQASGNFTGTTITSPSSVSSMGAIITYQDQSGTNALNTDIVLQLSADGGSNYTTATLTALPDFSTGIKMAKVNDVSVTAGTSLKYKISFANQSNGSKEARIRGVSLQY